MCYRVHYKNGNSYMIITIESACALSHTWQHGNTKTPTFELCKCGLLVFLSLQSLSSFIAVFINLHIAGHIYTTLKHHILLVYTIAMFPMELVFYCSLSVHATLIHAMGVAFCHSPSVHA